MAPRINEQIPLEMSDSWKEGKMNGRGHFHWELAGDLMTNAKYEGFFKDGVPTNIEIPAVGEPAEIPKNK